MIAAHLPIQRPRAARLLVIDSRGAFVHAPRSSFVQGLRKGDLVIANDAATLPASLPGEHVQTGIPIEIRLAARASLAPDDVHRFAAVIFGPGDFRTRTEDRPPPPTLAPGDRLQVGPLSASVEALLGHPRLARVRFDGTAAAIWSGLGRHGRPIQYAHVNEPLELWDVWTPIAATPAAFEPPSAGFVLDWAAVDRMRDRGVRFETLTLAAGISSTGDPELDRRLPFDEPYIIPESTARAIAEQRERGRRVIAIGTTVVRALEHAARAGGVIRAGGGVANQRLGPRSRLRIVDAVLTGTHEPGSSHYQLLTAFADEQTLRSASAALDAHGYRTHEFGDSMFVEQRLDVRSTEAAA
jgi:S-adenosylmethionine:tRNA ribosyltransferase-isomerase